MQWIASVWDSFQRVLSALIPPILMMRSCGFKLLLLLIQRISTRVAISASFWWRDSIIALNQGESIKRDNITKINRVWLDTYPSAILSRGSIRRLCLCNISILPLLGWTVFIGIRTIDTANSCQGTKDCAATDALVNNDSSIRRHLLGFGKPTLRTGNDSVQLNHQSGLLCACQNQFTSPIKCVFVSPTFRVDYKWSDPNPEEGQVNFPMLHLDQKDNKHPRQCPGTHLVLWRTTVPF